MCPPKDLDRLRFRFRAIATISVRIQASGATCQRASAAASQRHPVRCPGNTNADISRTSGTGGWSGRADDRQFRRRPSRPSGDAGAAHRGRRRPAPAAGGADVRSASARILRARTRRRRACRGCARSSSVPRLRHRPDHRRALRRAPRRADARSLHRRRAGAQARCALGAGRRRFPLRQARAPATSPCCARMRRRSASKACARSPWTRSARRRRAVREALAAGDLRAPRRCWAAPTRSAAASRTATSSAAAWAFRPRTFRCRHPPALSGIFAVRVHGLGSAPRTGVASLGVRPTVEAATGKPLLEVFLFDFDETIYGRRVTVEFLHKLRDEEKYDTLDALTRQIRADVVAGARLFRARGMMSAFPRFPSCLPMPDDTEDRLQVHAEPAGHAVPDARRPRQARAGLGEGLAGAQGLRGASAPRRRAGRASSCTTARRTPTATSTSATRSTRSSRTSSSRASSWPGFDAPYVPGWDCHGMPIEVQIEKTHGKNLSTAETQRLARAYATEQIEQAEGTTSSAWACWATGTIRTRRWRSRTRPTRSARSGKILEKGFVYRGLKPVNWCFDCRARWPKPKSSTRTASTSRSTSASRSIRTTSAKLAKAFGLAQLPDGDRVRGDLDHHAVDDSRQPGADRASGLHLRAGGDAARATWSSRRTWSRRASSAIELEGNVVATAPGAALERIRFRHPFYDRAVAGVPRRLRDAGAGHRHRAFVARLRRRGLPVVPQLRHEGRRHASIRCRATAAMPAACRSSAGEKIWEANPQIVDKLREVGALLHATKYTHSYMHCWRHKTPIIYRATTQWFAGHGRRARLARPRAAGDAARDGAARHRRHARSIRRGARRACTG